MIHELHSYADLRKQIHHDLRIQHPEWVRPDGECPVCDSYEARLMELLEGSTESESTNFAERRTHQLEQREIRSTTF